MAGDRGVPYFQRAAGAPDLAAAGATEPVAKAPDLAAAFDGLSGHGRTRPPPRMLNVAARKPRPTAAEGESQRMRKAGWDPAAATRPGPAWPGPVGVRE